MNHQDHVNLIKKGVPAIEGAWADLGSGRGAFTLALAECLPANSEIYSVDIDRRALRNQDLRIRTEYPAIDLEIIEGDFTSKLDLPPLDGILMANSLHFVREKLPVIQLIRNYLKENGRLIMVEYDTNEGNAYVPYPMTYDMWATLATQAGFRHTEKIGARPSSFLGHFFSALSYK